MPFKRKWRFSATKNAKFEAHFHRKFLSFQNTLFEVIWSTYTHKYNHLYKLRIMCILKMWEIFQKIYIYIIFEKTKKTQNKLHAILMSVISTIRYKSFKKKIAAIYEKMTFEHFWKCRNLSYFSQKTVVFSRNFTWHYLKHIYS